VSATLTFDLLTLKLVRNVARVPSCQFCWYYDYSFSIYGPLGQHGSDKSHELVTLTFDLGDHVACGWCGSSSSIRIPTLKFLGLAIRKIWRTMCVSVNGPSDPELLYLKLMWVASFLGGQPSFHIWALYRPLGSRIIRYVRHRRTHGQTDRRMDNSNTYCSLPYGRGIIKRFILITLYFFEYAIFKRRFESRDSILWDWDLLATTSEELLLELRLGSTEWRFYLQVCAVSLSLWSTDITLLALYMRFSIIIAHKR